jgi:beta-glucosidase
MKTPNVILIGALSLPWVSADTPEDLASALLAQMTLDEKISMVHGTNQGNYVGNTLPISRLGIPALTMNDGPQGFRSECCPGTTTQYPAAINIAATFDVNAALEWGTAMGEEFVTKGSNVQLGPGLNVARVPLNGRNFEYLSGEDPFLGTHMVKGAVNGIQSQKVIANAKHYVNNNQVIFYKHWTLTLLFFSFSFFFSYFLLLLNEKYFYFLLYIHHHRKPIAKLWLKW